MGLMLPIVLPLAIGIFLVKNAIAISEVFEDWLISNGC